ncbi:MAG: hypothetical protein KAU20_06025 [Nanoarchaeota archaeon]|nr:hypothetical protein [Nanoarchaeota archaeon]
MKKLISVMSLVFFIPFITFAVGSVNLNEISVQCGVPQHLQISGNVVFNADTDILFLDVDGSNGGDYLNITNTENGNKWTYDNVTGDWLNNKGIRINSLGEHIITARLYDMVTQSIIIEASQTISIIECPLPEYRTFWEYTVDLTPSDIEFVNDELVLHSTENTKQLQPGDTIVLESDSSIYSIVLSDDNIFTLATTTIKLQDTNDMFVNTELDDKKIVLSASVNYLEKSWYYKVKNKLTQYLLREPTHNEIMNSQTGANIIEWVAEDEEYVTSHLELQHQIGQDTTITIAGIVYEEPVVKTVEQPSEEVVSSGGGGIPLPIIWGTAPCFGMWGDGLDACIKQKYPNGEYCELVPVKTCVGVLDKSCVPEPLKCKSTLVEELKLEVDRLLNIIDNLLQKIQQQLIK